MANARLIAAAPDLLHALEYAHEFIQHLPCADASVGDFENPVTLKELLSAALAKATGQEVQP